MKQDPSAKTGPDQPVITPLVRTGTNSWLETDPNQVQFDQGKDTKGPITVAVSAVKQPPPDAQGNQPPGGRLIVFGDSDFATNQFAQGLGNLDLFVNSVNWLTNDPNLISIRPKPADNRQMFLTMRAQFIFVVTCSPCRCWWGRA